MNTYKVQLWFIIWWTTDTYTGSRWAIVNAVDCMNRKPKWLKWRVTNE